MGGAQISEKNLEFRRIVSKRLLGRNNDEWLGEKIVCLHYLFLLL